jgi:hypothetical protein
MDILTQEALNAVLEISALHKVYCEKPHIISNRANLIIHLFPHTIIGKVATSTALARKFPLENLRLDLDIAVFLMTQNIPVTSPSERFKTEVHLCKGFGMTFWKYEEVISEEKPSLEEAQVMLVNMHKALKKYQGKLPIMGILFDEMPQWLFYIEKSSLLQSHEIDFLKRVYQYICSKITLDPLKLQPLHGDAHLGNILKTTQGFKWTDFEDACLGPTTWDFVTLNYLESASEKESNYHELRFIEGVLWYHVLATRLDYHEKAQKAFKECLKRYAFLNS